MRRKEFADFLNKCHLEYSIQQGRQVTAKEFAEYLAASPTTYSNWINTGTIPSMRWLDILADKLGIGVYAAAGHPRHAVPLDKLPVEIRDQLTRFVSEMTLELEGVDPESPEYAVIVKSFMDKFGFAGKENS